MTHVFDANLGYNRVETLDNKREGRKSLWICSGFKLCQPTLLPQPYSKKKQLQKPNHSFCLVCMWFLFSFRFASGKHLLHKQPNKKPTKSSSEIWLAPEYPVLLCMPSFVFWLLVCSCRLLQQRCLVLVFSSGFIDWSLPKKLVALYFYFPVWFWNIFLCWAYNVHNLYRAQNSNWLSEGK